MKRTRADSAQSAVKAMVDAAKGPPEVPGHVRMREGDAPFWDGIVRARAYDEWTGADLVVAAQLARTQADIEREQETLDCEGSVLKNERGTQVANPRVSILENLARREMALMRSLRMTGTAAGDSRDEATRRKVQKAAEKVRADLAEDELLAT
ncbi:MAG: hypothetical protein NUV51_04410 [Sulfuricaulis sp.]|nr:hypothetical protein [Sulfuricaulis sp.]